MVRLHQFLQLTPSLPRIMDLKERGIAKKVGITTKQFMSRAQMLLEA